MSTYPPETIRRNWFFTFFLTYWIQTWNKTKSALSLHFQKLDSVLACRQPYGTGINCTDLENFKEAKRSFFLMSFMMGAVDCVRVYILHTVPVLLSVQSLKQKQMCNRPRSGFYHIFFIGFCSPITSSTFLGLMLVG